MARYIDADLLKDEYYGLFHHGTMTVKSALPIFVDLLDKQPTADVVEVKHGEWRLEECQCGLFSITQFFVCFACNEEFDVDGWDYEDLRANVKYCPNCGAKMDGGEAE